MEVGDKQPTSIVSLNSRKKKLKLLIVDPERHFGGNWECLYYVTAWRGHAKRADDILISWLSFSYDSAPGLIVKTATLEINMGTELSQPNPLRKSGRVAAL